MVRSFILCLVIVLLAFFGSVSLAQEAKKDRDSPDKERIEQLIRDLASEDFRVREKATEELQKIGAGTVQFLKEALKSDDPEVRWRAESILKKIENPQPLPERSDATQPQRKEQPEELREKPSLGTEIPVPPNEEEPLKQIERLVKELEEARKEALREVPDFSQQTARSLEELKEWLKQQKIAPEKEMEELLQRMERLRSFAQDKEKTATQGKSVFRYRVWKDGKLVTDQEKEEFFGASLFGLTLSSVSDRLRYHLDIQEGEGLLVESITDTSPFFGKLEKYDVILSVDQTSVSSLSSPQKLVSNKDKVTLTIIRKGKRSEVEVTLKKEIPEEKGKQ
jgi:hypothetical protein